MTYNPFPKAFQQNIQQRLHHENCSCIVQGRKCLLGQLTDLLAFDLCLTLKWRWQDIVFWVLQDIYESLISIQFKKGIPRNPDPPKTTIWGGGITYGWRPQFWKFNADPWFFVPSRKIYTSSTKRALKRSPSHASTNSVPPRVKRKSHVKAKSPPAVNQEITPSRPPQLYTKRRKAPITPFTPKKVEK